MKIYTQLLLLLIISLVSQAIYTFFKLPIPASVIGMLILFTLLQTKILHINKIETIADFLTNNLAILFIPSGVGIISKLHLIKEIWFSFFVIAIFSTVISIIVSVKTVEFINKKLER